MLKTWRMVCERLATPALNEWFSVDLCIRNTKWTLDVGIQEINGASETLC